MSFEADVQRVERGLTTGTGKLIGELAFTALQTVVLASPVGDPNLWKRRPPPGYAGGRFRGNWQIGVGSPNTTELDTTDASGQGTIAKGRHLLGYKLGDGDIWIWNNLPYAQRLNEGHSRQAPAGFVEQAIQAATMSLEGKRVDF